MVMRSGSADGWWLRSPRIYSSNVSLWWTPLSSGGLGSYMAGASASSPVAFGFSKTPFSGSAKYWWLRTARPSWQDNGEIFATTSSGYYTGYAATQGYLANRTISVAFGFCQVV